jgi:hypothetical protein
MDIKADLRLGLLERECNRRTAPYFNTVKLRKIVAKMLGRVKRRVPSLGAQPTH